jgi:hypothetical protein
MKILIQAHFHKIFGFGEYDNGAGNNGWIL